MEQPCTPTPQPTTPRRAVHVVCGNAGVGKSHFARALARRERALLLDLETTPQLGIRRSLAAAKLPPASQEYLAPRSRVTYFFEPAPPRRDEA